jgi:hypothetical protein
MSCCEWIVCEHSSRWASALRLALASGGTRYRLRETRHLAGLAAELAEQPTSLAAIEVRRGNLADILAWLTTARQTFPRARCVALLDRSLAKDAEQVGDALFEAGAQAIAASPRRLDTVLALGQRHAAAVAQHSPLTDDNLSFTAQVWASLPWQGR